MSTASDSSALSSLRKPLPEKILLAYTGTRDLTPKTTKAVQDGVNVLIWCFIAFEPFNDDTDGSVHLRITSHLDKTKFVAYKQALKDLGYTDVIHLAAFGGWNGPHLPTGFKAEELYQTFVDFNNPNEEEFSDEPLFDGIDWDLEGNDDIQSPRNEFTKECLDQMGEFSALIKRDGYIVSMAPPESYLDITSESFSRFVNLSYPDPWHEDFEYHGRNVYAYILARWDHVIDFIFLQFYESYSHAAYQITQLKKSPEQFLIDYITRLVEQQEKMYVKFEDDPLLELENQYVPFPLSKLLLGFANGWALNDDIDDRAVFFDGAAVAKAYNYLVEKGQEPRGMGFWVVGDEGQHNVNYAEDLNRILKIRNDKDSSKTNIEVREK